MGFGSKITALGIIFGCLNKSFLLDNSSVTPEIALNSPPDKVVGIVIWGTVGAFTPSVEFKISIIFGSLILLDKQRATALAASVIDPPPNVTIRSALLFLAASEASITSLRGV